MYFYMIIYLGVPVYGKWRNMYSVSDSKLCRRKKSLNNSNFMSSSDCHEISTRFCVSQHVSYKRRSSNNIAA